MRTYTLLLMASILLTAPAESQARDSTRPTILPSGSLLALIDAFLTRPFANPDLRTALIDSAEARSDVAITISQQLLPWILETDTTVFRRAMRGLFLSAFVAGNMREQLVSRVKGDQPYAGVVAVLDVYLMVRARAPAYRQPTLDEWLHLREQGKLRQHVAQLAQPGK